MYVFVKSFYNIICSRLVVYVIIRIGEAPEHGGIPHIFCDLQSTFTVFPFWRPEERIHFISGRFFHVIGVVRNLFPDSALVAFRHTDVVGGVIPYHMPFFFHSFYQVRLILNEMLAYKKGGGSFVLFKNIKYARSITILITAVKSEKNRLFSVGNICFCVPGIILRQINFILNFRYFMIFIAFKPPGGHSVGQGGRVRIYIVVLFR